MTLVLAVAQPVCVDRDLAANALAHAAAVRQAHARVVVFPELSLTGYDLGADLVETDDPRLAPLVEACAETGTVALAGAPVDGPFLGILRIDEGGVTVAYRKQYPGGGEPERFRAGPGPAVTEVDGWRLGLAICRDTGIAEHAAGTATLGMDAYVAGLTDHRHEDVKQEERARRIATTHGVWVAFASFAGPTGEGYSDTAGRSGIWSPDGTEVARAGRSPGEIVQGTMIKPANAATVEESRSGDDLR